jgi:hypothetical protein
MALEFKFTIKDDGSATIKNISQNVNVLQNNFTKVDASTNNPNPNASATRLF